MLRDEALARRHEGHARALRWAGRSWPDAGTSRQAILEKGIGEMRAAKSELDARSCRQSFAFAWASSLVSFMGRLSKASIAWGVVSLGCDVRLFRGALSRWGHIVPERWPQPGTGILRIAFPDYWCACVAWCEHNRQRLLLVVELSSRRG